MTNQTPIKAIRSHCIDCCCGSKKEVKLCPATSCSLYPYRMGHRPKESPDSQKTAAQLMLF